MTAFQQYNAECVGLARTIISKAEEIKELKEGLKDNQEYAEIFEKLKYYKDLEKAFVEGEIGTELEELKGLKKEFKLASEAAKEAAVRDGLVGEDAELKFFGKFFNLRAKDKLNAVFAESDVLTTLDGALDK